MNTDSLTPTVGMGATLVLPSDRRAFTVIEVQTSRRIVVQRDIAKLVGQEYEFERDPNGEQFTINLRKDGYWFHRTRPLHFKLGERKEYSSPWD